MNPLDAALGGVGALSSIIGTGMSNSTNKKIARENRAWSEAMWNKQSAWQEDMLNKQYAWQESMWNKENEYNTASAQMQRLIDAGINPNNAAGMAGAGEASFASAPSVPMPASMPTQNPIPMQPYNINDGLRVAKELAMMDKEKESIQSGIDLNSANVRKILDGDIPKAQADALLSKSQEELNQEIKNGVTIGNTFLADKNQAELDKIGAEVAKIVEEKESIHLSNEQSTYVIKELLPLQKKLTTTQIQEVLSSVAKNHAEANAANAAAERNRAEAGVLGIQAEQLESQSGAISEEAALRREKASQAIFQLKALGVEISESEYDDITKMVLHIQSAQHISFDEAVKQVESILDGTVQYSGYYFRQNLNRKFGKGSASHEDYLIGTGMYGNDEFSRSVRPYYDEVFRRIREKGDWNPSDRNKK